MAEGYATDGPAIELGRGVLGGELHQDAPVRILLANAPATNGPADIGDFLHPCASKALQKKVIRGVFGTLRKRL